MINYSFSNNSRSQSSDAEYQGNAIPNSSLPLLALTPTWHCQAEQPDGWCLLTSPLQWCLHWSRSLKGQQQFLEGGWTHPSVPSSCKDALQQGSKVIDLNNRLLRFIHAAISQSASQLQAFQLRTFCRIFHLTNPKSPSLPNKKVLAKLFSQGLFTLYLHIWKKPKQVILHPVRRICFKIIFSPCPNGKATANFSC